jgi:hypothetical protein
MWTCPVPNCGEKKKKKGAKQHMTKMHPDYECVDPVNLVFRKKPIRKKATPTRVVKEAPVTDAPKSFRRLKDPISINLEPPKAPIVEKKVVERRRVKIPREKKPRADMKTRLMPLKRFIPRRKEKKKREFDPNWDPEPTLELVTKMPLILILGVVAYKYFTDPGFFTQFLDNDVVELYKYVFMDITSPGAIIILALTAIIVLLLSFLLYKMVWRFMFKDLQIRKGFSGDENSYRKGPGTSFEGRIYLIVGDGFWDRIYRKYTKRPKPKLMTVYFRRGIRDPSFLNPFKVLASCHKGLLDNTAGNRFIRDGLFKRTLIATHMRRGSQDESTVYYFEDSRYDDKPFGSEWYGDRHAAVIKEHLAKVSKACLMDSTTQKRQMENVIAWLPSSEVMEQERVWELKKEAELREQEEALKAQSVK